MATTLTKGQNAPVTTNQLQVSLEVNAAVDVSALLVTDAGTVRTDADFVFYNQPSGPGVTLASGVLHIDTTAIPGDISAVRAVATMDGGRSFGDVAAPTAHVGAGAQVFDYRIDGLRSESVVIAVEIYRRGADWKVRAVGQGYAGGFAELVRDHGVSVDDAPQPAPATAVASPPAPQAPSSPPAPQAPSSPPAPQAAQAPPASSWPQQSPGEVSLTKDRPVSLVKGQRVSLRKEGGTALTSIKMGLGWDPIVAPKRGLFGGGRTANIDLDASVVMYGNGELKDLVYYRQLSSKDGSIRHHGDNLTGEGDGDDEVIDVDLTRVPPHVTALTFIVTSYQGQTFEQIDNAFCRLVDNTTGYELARYTLAGGMPFTGIVMAQVFRGAGGWKMQAVGEGMQARHPGEAVKALEVSPWRNQQA